MNAIFLHDYPLAVEPGSRPRLLVQKRTWRDSLPIDMLLSDVSVLVVAQSISEILEGLMNNPVYPCTHVFLCVLTTSLLRFSYSTYRSVRDTIALRVFPNTTV